MSPAYFILYYKYNHNNYITNITKNNNIILQSLVFPYHWHMRTLTFIPLMRQPFRLCLARTSQHTMFLVACIQLPHCIPTV